MASEGIVVIGDKLEAYSERNSYVSWDINPDLRNDKVALIEEPFYRISDFRYGIYNEIDHIYITRWAQVVRAYQPITERYATYNYKIHFYNERTGYFYLDTRERKAFVEALLTQTPLTLKYPKYYNWNYIPQVLTPEFNVWSYYDLDENSIVIKVVSSSGKMKILSSSTDKDKFDIKKVSKHVYNIKCYIDTVFEPGEQVSVYVSMNDVKGNYLKPGYW